jgi:hypothetical protein
VRFAAKAREQSLRQPRTCNAKRGDLLDEDQAYSSSSSSPEDASSFLENDWLKT